MRVKTLIRFRDESFVEFLLTNAGLVARDKKDCLAFRVERESYSPFAVSRAEAKLFHVRVAGAIQSVHARPSQLRSELLQKSGERKNFGPHVLVKIVELRLELRLELVADFNGPRHV